MIYSKAVLHFMLLIQHLSFLVFQVASMPFCYFKSKLNTVCNINQLEKNSPGKCMYFSSKSSMEKYF